MTGACLEDVNHEVYGGIYSQMLYGECFQEPAPFALKGFDWHGGEWACAAGTLSVTADLGGKVVAKGVQLGDGEVGLDMRLTRKQDGFVGLIIKVREAARGADAFIGYEIALNPAKQVLRLGRHRHNWEHISDTPCTVALDQWMHLNVTCKDASLDISLDGRRVVQFDDTEHPLEAGSVGLRTWGVDAQFRNFTICQGGQTTSLPLNSKKGAGPVSGMWEPFQNSSARGVYDLCADDPFQGRQSQRLTFVEGQGEIGIANQGLNRWGLCTRAGKSYEGILWARCEQPVAMAVALESADGGEVYGQKSLSLKPGPWQRLEFELIANKSDKRARFVVKLMRPGSVVLGYAFLQPGPWGRFQGLPVRKDVADALIDQGLTVLRYGGLMANADAYHWKDMIGPRDLRPPYRGFWFRHSSHGWGIIDFIDFCRAAGFLCIPDFNMEETPQDMADFVEYVNGPINSRWGRRRAQDGHPEPYHLRYIQLGNEEAVDEAYWLRFKPLAEAIWQADPNMTVIVGDFAYSRAIEDPYDFKGAPRIRSLSTHKKILDLAVQHGREVWFDVHVGTDKPRDPDGLGGIPSFIESLQRINPAARFKVAVLELNAGNHGLGRALSNAHAINELERLGDHVPAVCSANCLQPYKQNENGWDQGLLFLDPSQVWAQPPYYVTQMVSRHYQPLCLETVVECPDGALDVTAKRSEDGRTTTLSVVNVASHPVKTRIRFGTFAPRKDTAIVVRLTGGLNEINHPENPRRVIPAETIWPLVRDESHETIVYTFPEHSFTILKVE